MRCDVIENKGGHRVFYSGGKPVQRELDLQIMFRLVWCGTPYDVSTEVNDGRGPADFHLEGVTMHFDLLQRKRTHFMLWRPRCANPPPALIIGTLLAGNPPSFQLLNRFDLAPSTVSTDLWEVAAAACG